MKLKKTKRRIRPNPTKRPRERAGRNDAPIQTSSADAQRIALLAAQAGLDKKALAVEIVDVTGKVDYADYLVLMSGQSDRHVAAIAESVDDVLGKSGVSAISIEGLPRGQWVLIDFVDVVVHVFLEESRALYDLDGLWMDARRVPLPATPGEA